MTCNQNNSIDPLQNIIDTSTGEIDTLEAQARGITPYVDDFRSQGTGFDPNSISPSSTINTALNALTSEVLCASVSDIEPINDLVGDCLSIALANIKKYANNVLNNIEDGLDAISEILALPESDLMKALQKIWGLTSEISDLIAAINKKLQCVSLSQQASEYADQIQLLQDRVTTVTDDLYLAEDGSFDEDILMTGFDTALKDNIKSFKAKSEIVQKEINETINAATGSSTKNPKRYF